jgi:putative membrane protein
VRSWSPTRVATGVALAAWATLFWFLIISGRTLLYLSTRTSWVVPVGAVILTAAAIGRLATARAPHPEPLAGRHAVGMGIVTLPVVAILALPPASLGSYAASRRSVSVGYVSTGGEITGDISLVDVAAANWSKQGQEALIRKAGSEVSFLGRVTEREGLPADEFYLTRFMVSCCVADALSVQVRVVGAPPGSFRHDQWVRVTGTLYPVSREVIVAASGVEPVPQPERPYLNP